MSDERKPVEVRDRNEAVVMIRANLATGETTVNHAGDVLIALKICNEACDALIEQMARSRNRMREQMKEQVKVAAAGELRALDKEP